MSNKEARCSSFSAKFWSLCNTTCIYQSLWEYILGQTCAVALTNIESCRVRVKAPYPIKKEGSTTPPRGKSPSPPCSRLQTRSPSPALLVGTSHQMVPPSTNTRDLQCTSSGSEPNSPTRAPPTPPRQSMAGGIMAGSSGGRDFGRQPDSMACQSKKSLQEAPQDETSEAMEEDAS